MALGSWLQTKWAPNATDVKRDEYGAFLVDIRKHKGFTAKDAADAYQSAKLLEPYYAKGGGASPAADWSKDPRAAAVHAYQKAATDAGSYYTTPSAAAVAGAWN